MNGLHRRAWRYFGLAVCAWVLAAVSACGGGGDIEDEPVRGPQRPAICIEKPELCA